MIDEDYDAFPDFESLASSIIRNALSGSRVYSSIPDKPTWPLIVVKRVGGSPIEAHSMDLAQIQVDVWGGSKSEARDLAVEARVALHLGECETYAVSLPEWPEAGFIAKVTDTTGLSWSPDPSTNRDRYVFGVSISGHS